MKFCHRRSQIKLRSSNHKLHPKTRSNQLQTCLKTRLSHLQSHLKMRSSHRQYPTKIIKVLIKKELKKILSKRNLLAQHLVLRCISLKILKSKKNHYKMCLNKTLCRNQPSKGSKIRFRSYKTSS